VRLRTLDVPLARLPEELAGLRIAHLSDFHFGLPSRGTVAVERAIDWVEQRKPDLVAITVTWSRARAANPCCASSSVGSSVRSSSSGTTMSSTVGIPSRGLRGSQT